MKTKLSSSLWLIIHLVKMRLYRDCKTCLIHMIILFLKLHHR
nr:MAG TPA: hypothetical protein [Caudoviricetes sp.]